MAKKTFRLVATVSTDNPAAIRTVLRDFVGNRGIVEEIGLTGEGRGSSAEFQINTKLAGETAKELNRTLLSALRKTEKKTRLRATWSSGGVVQQYFDYVLKKTSKEQG